MKEEWKKFAVLVVLFILACFLPLGSLKVKEAIYEAFRLL